MATQAVAVNQKRQRVIASDPEEEQRTSNKTIHPSIFNVFQPLVSLSLIDFLFPPSGLQGGSTSRSRARSYVNNRSTNAS